MTRRHWIALLAVTLWWTLEGLATAGQLLTMAYDGEILGPVAALRRGLLSAWLCIPCSLLLLWCVERVPIERGQVVRSLCVLMAATLVVVVARAAIVVGANPVLGWYRVVPPFHEVLVTSLLNNFLMSWLTIGVGHAVLYAERAYERQRQAEQLQARLTETRLEALRAQLDPHFLFNALNSIAETIHHDPAAADRMLVGLGELLRSSLDQRRTRLVPLHEELRLLRNYLDIEKARLGARLRLHWNIDPDLGDALVPPLLLQPLAENAVKHAIAEKIAPGHMELAAWRDDGRLCLAVRDDGAAAGGRGHDGVGLANVRARLECLYGADQMLVLRSLADGGTEARVCVPLQFDALARRAA